MGILHEIVLKKKERLKDSVFHVPLSELKEIIGVVEKPRDFRSSIERHRAEKIRLIAEIKKASPSGGIIRREFDSLSIARIYETKPVDAVSVLTEEDYFQGRLTFLPDVKKATAKPVLRKDFIFDEYQIYESRAYEADAILLIASILERNQAAEYLHLAGELGLAVLFEVHDFKELEMALMTNCDIIGINNRDLTRMEIDMNTTFSLKKEIPPGRIIVSESGIRTEEDVRKLESAGIDAMLIGTTFMEAEDIGGKIDELMNKI
jgi:indole-3-glycerol phosphate synthase